MAFAIRNKKHDLYLTRFDGTEGWGSNRPPLLFDTNDQAEQVAERTWDRAFWARNGIATEIEVVDVSPES